MNKCCIYHNIISHIYVCSTHAHTCVCTYIYTCIYMYIYIKSSLEGHERNDDSVGSLWEGREPGEREVREVYFSFYVYLITFDFFYYMHIFPIQNKYN